MPTEATITPFDLLAQRLPRPGDARMITMDGCTWMVDPADEAFLRPEPALSGACLAKLVGLRHGEMRGTAPQGGAVNFLRDALDRCDTLSGCLERVRALAYRQAGHLRYPGTPLTQAASNAMSGVRSSWVP